MRNLKYNDGIKEKERMKHSYYYLKTAITLLLTLMGGAGSAWADTKLYVEDFSITAGETKQVAVCLDTDESDIMLIEGTIRLPEGLSFKADGSRIEASVDKSRSSGFSLESASKTGKFMFNKWVSGSLKAGNGAIFRVTVMAAKPLGFTSEQIIITGAGVRRSDRTAVTVSTPSSTVKAEGQGGQQGGEDDSSAALKKLYDDWTAKIVAVQQELKDMVEQIKAKYPATMEAMQTEISAVEDKIAKVKTQLDDLYNTKALTASTTFDLTAIKEDIAALLPSAKKKSEEASGSIYDKLKTEIAALQKLLDTNKANIQKDCDDAIAATAATEAKAIQAQIDKLQADLDAQLKAGKLTADSKIDAKAKQAIEEAIAAMYFKAVKSQNDKTYEALLQELKALEDKLAEARQTIEKEYGEEAAKAAKADLDAIQKTIDETRAALKKQHDNLLITKSTTIDKAAIQAAIEKALAAAKGGQENPDAPDNPDDPEDPDSPVPPSKEAQALYKALTADLNALQRQLDNAIAEMARKYDADILEATKQAFDELQQTIDAKKAEIEKLYKANKLDKETTIDKASFTAALDKAKEDTKALQAEKNYKTMTAVIAELETELAKAKDEVAKNAADVASEFRLQFTLIEQLLTKLKEQVEKEQKEGWVDINNMASADVIRNSLKTLLEDAAKRETVFLVNQKLTEKLDRTEALLESVIEQIRADYADVADGFKDRMAEIQQMIDDLRKQLRKQYLRGNLDEQSDIDVTAVRQAITDLLKAAQEAHTVGIASVTTVDGTAKEMYDLNGQRIDRPKRGTVVIVRTQDGKRRKRLVK